MTRKNNSSVSQLVRLLRTTLTELGHHPSPQEVESLAFLVYQAMTGSEREYHGVGHVFTVARGLPPLGRLAAIYHDTIYTQVDNGFVPAIWDKIKGTGRIDKEGRFKLALELDDLTSDVATIFGFAPGSVIAASDGLNEFLSALFAMRELSDVVTLKEAWTIAACIEATIPFRGKDSEGRSPAEALESRLKRLSSAGAIRLTEKEAAEAVRLAVRVSNSDVQSFAQIDVGAFLDDTWKLLPETNPEFHRAGTYSIRSYLEAMHATEAFLSGLDPALIFQQHRGAPSDRVFNALASRAHGNLTKACEYLRAKIVTVSLLEALAVLTGGDAPISYFTGSAESDEVTAYSYLPQDETLPPEGLPACDAMVLHVLLYGRMRVSRFDTNQSSLSAYLYEMLGTEGIRVQAERSKKVRAGKHDWEWYVGGFAPELVSAIASAVAEIAVERKPQLLKLAGAGNKARKAA